MLTDQRERYKKEQHLMLGYLHKQGMNTARDHLGGQARQQNRGPASWLGQQRENVRSTPLFYVAFSFANFSNILAWAPTSTSSVRISSSGLVFCASFIPPGNLYIISVHAADCTVCSSTLIDFISSLPPDAAIARKRLDKRPLLPPGCVDGA